jgi:subtilisin family serine protease
MRLEIAETLVLLAGVSLLAACGGGGGGGGAPAPTYAIRGTVAGLTDTGLVVQNNGGDSLSVASGASTFTFATRLTTGSRYAVTISSQPANQYCRVANGSGTVGSSDVDTVNIACVNYHTIGGSVTSLAGAAITLQDNGSDNLSVAANGAFTFSRRIAEGMSYGVTLLAQPSGQACSVANGNGTMRASDVTNVSVACVSSALATFTDPLVAQQWYLRNAGQSAYADVGGTAGIDIDVDPVYSSSTLTGSSVIVAVVDTGLEIAHEDLSSNVVSNGSWNFLNSTTDPTSAATAGDHGTSVAGIIAMARNSVGGIGVAPAASLKGFNFLASTTQSLTEQVDSLGASASSPNSSDVAIFNQSYGTSMTSDAPIDPTVEAQYANGASSLRGGKGAVYVKAAGNGFLDMGELLNLNCIQLPGISCENANFDPENTIPYQIIVGATNANGVKASYSTAGSAIWINAPGGEGGFNAAVAPGYTSDTYQPAIITTDQSGCTKGYSISTANTSVFDNGGAPNSSCNYTNTMAGTSAAVPVTSGVIALMLEANPALTWRDVKHILAATARKIDQGLAAASVALSDGSYAAEPAWTTNAAGYSFHNWYGFGMVDASAAVNMATSYASQLGTFADTGWISSGALSLAIPDNSVTGASHTLTVPAATVQSVEEVQIRVSATHTYTGDLAIELTSPSGTRSVLKTGNDGFDGATGLNGMVLISNAFYGESAAGNWTIKIVDAAAVDTGTLTQWSIRVFGH